MIMLWWPENAIYSLIIFYLILNALTHLYIFNEIFITFSIY